MKEQRDFYTEYESPQIPSGRLIISSTSNFRFPIQEKSANGLVGELNVVLEKAYLQGLSDGAEPSLEHSKTSCDDKRIQHVYRTGNYIMIAGHLREVCDPQSIFCPNDNLDLCVKRINDMIDRAKRRGHDLGYQEGLDDCSPIDDDDPTDW